MELIRLLDVVATTPQERAAWVTMELLVAGRELTTVEIAAHCGVTRQAAHAMLDGISRVVPIFHDGGHWRRAD